METGVPSQTPAKVKPAYISWRLAEDIVERPVNWLWLPYIPRGKVTLLEGDPGLGKSFLTAQIAADISTGRLLPGQTADFEMPPQNVIILSGEDDPEDTIKPRLRSAGADMSRVVVLGDEMNSLEPRYIAALREILGQFSAAVFFLDPLSCFFGAEKDMNAANQVRPVMKSLQKLAEDTKCAVICIRHLRKSGGENKVYKGLGSIDFIASVRSVLQVSDVKTQGSDIKIIEHVKSNLEAKGPDIAYSIKGGVFKWEGVYDRRRSQISGKGPATLRCESFLLTFFSDHNDDWVDSNDVKEALRKEGISDITFRRVKTNMIDWDRRGLRTTFWRLKVKPVEPLGLPDPLVPLDKVEKKRTLKPSDPKTNGVAKPKDIDAIVAQAKALVDAAKQ